MKNKRTKMNKLGLSMIVSYVLLVSIAVTLGAISYVFLKEYPNMIQEKLDCGEGTSMIIESVSGDEDGSEKLIINVKNNGLFNIDGFAILVGDDVNKAPTMKLASADGVETKVQGDGNYVFLSSLEPEDSLNANFNKDLNYIIQIIQIQPFVFIDNEKVLCSGKTITHKIGTLSG